MTCQIQPFMLSRLIWISLTVKRYCPLQSGAWWNIFLNRQRNVFSTQFARLSHWLCSQSHLNYSFHWHSLGCRVGNRKFGLPPDSPHLQAKCKNDQRQSGKKTPAELFVFMKDSKSKCDAVNRLEVKGKIYCERGQFFQCIYRELEGKHGAKPCEQQQPNPIRGCWEKLMDVQIIHKRSHDKR